MDQRVMNGQTSSSVPAPAVIHATRVRLPLELARLHARTSPGVVVELKLRRSANASWARLALLLEGAGFTNAQLLAGGESGLRLRAVRARTLPDFIAPRLLVLICGLNPSLYAADSGVPFGRPGNRFWPAAVRAGLVTVPRDPYAALARGVGFTDLVKRATSGIDELARDEYEAGMARVAAVTRLFRPRTLCLVGLDGWRKLIDRRAQPGWIAGGFGGGPAYLMPSTSGRNARTPLTDLAAHLARAAGSIDARNDR